MFYPRPFGQVLLLNSKVCYTKFVYQHATGEK